MDFETESRATDDTSKRAPYPIQALDSTSQTPERHHERAHKATENPNVLSGDVHFSVDTHANLDSSVFDDNQLSGVPSSGHSDTEQLHQDDLDESFWVDFTHLPQPEEVIFSGEGLSSGISQTDAIN